MSCQKEDEITKAIPTKPAQIQFRNSLNIIDRQGVVSNLDTMSWRFRDSFNPYVRFLFNMDSSVKTYKNDSMRFFTFPIPTDNFLVLNLHNYPYCYNLKYIIVDKNYNIKNTDSTLYVSTNYSKTLYLDSCSKGDTYRIFYKLTIGKKTVTGYGDFNRKK